MMQFQRPMGLQSLMQQPQKPQQSELPADLQALIRAQQILRAKASPVTPDGRPTIAGMTEQAIAQQAAPQQEMSPPQVGAPQVPPQSPGTVAQAAQAAGIAGQQQQAAQQQAMQQAMQMAQQQGQLQGMARGGLASLPAENIARMKYAQGGVIGFNGEDEYFGSSVPMSYSEQMSNLAGVIPKLLRRIVSAPETASEYEARKKEEEQKYAAKPNLKPMEELAAAAKDYVPEEVPARTNDLAAAMQVLAEARKRQAAPAASSASPRISAPSAPAQAAMPVNPDLEAVRRMRDEQFKGTAPTPESVLAEKEKFRQAQGLQGLVGSAIEDAMKRAEARSAETKAAYEQGIQGRGLEDMIAALSAGARSGRAGGLGAQYVSSQQANRQADMQFRQLMDASAEKRDQMAATVQAMREAAANNDAATYQKEMETYRKQKHDFDTVNRQLASSALQSSTTMQEGALNRAATERLHAMDNQFRLALHQSPTPSLEREILQAYMKQGLSMPQAYERLMNIKTGDRADVAHEKNMLARQKLLESDMQYKTLTMTAAIEKDPAKKAKLQADIEAYERQKGILPPGAAGGSPDKLSAADRIAGVK